LTALEEALPDPDNEPAGGLSMKRLTDLWTAALAVAALSVASADAADFYEGKQIRVTTGGVAGGGNDIFTRLLTAHMGKYIPGNPSFLVSNMTEAGGLRVAGYTYNVAKKDGTEFTNFLRASLLEPLLGQEAAQFKPQEFNWIGTPSSYADDGFLFVIRSALPYKTIDDLRKASTPLSVAQRGDIFTLLTREAVGANLKFITGYKGGEDILALRRGEIDAMGASFNNTMRKDDMGYKEGFIRVMVQYGHDQRMKDLPNVPMGRELTSNPDDLALIKFSEEPLSLGSPFGAPPGVPADRVEILRKAFKQTMEDAEYKAAIVKAGSEYSPKYHDHIDQVLKGLFSAPPAVIARFKKMSEMR
jgi:tripartite-type tricarboxylate transporter receptor subunit TctC